MTRAEARSAARCRSPAILGDQQAATVGQVCFAPGEAKNTYGTGNFLLLNTGTELVRSKPACSPRCATGSATSPVVYALEGSIAVTGSAVQWLRDQLGSSAAPRRARRWPVRSRTTAASTSCRRSRAVRAVLALGRARRDRRPVAVQHQRPPGPGDAGGDLLPEPRRRRGDGEGLRRPPGSAQGRRRRDRQRAVHADPGRRPRCGGQPAGGRRDDGARRGVRRRPRGRLLGEHRRAARELERGTTLVAAVE